MHSSWFVGCACDPGYAEHTAVLLASLDLNGAVPEAQIVVAGFGLMEDDKRLLRAAAGRLAQQMRIVDVTPAMLGPFGIGGGQPPFPIALLGRFIVPEQISARHARLLQLDSDTVVNRSLRPLFELRMHEAFIAACHDFACTTDLNYFNAGVMLIDVDRYKGHQIAKRCMQWLADANPLPHFLDQDALNVIVGDVWHRLDHCWNFHAHPGPPRTVTAADYENAGIAHFAAGKPWHHSGHAGRGLYERYHDELGHRRRLRSAVMEQVDAMFVATAFELFLGRAPDAAELAQASGCGAGDVIRRLLQRHEFIDHVLLPLALGRPFNTGRFAGCPTLQHRLWMTERLDMAEDTADIVRNATRWRDLLELILADDLFQRYAAITRLMRLTHGVNRAIFTPPSNLPVLDAAPLAASTSPSTNTHD